MATTSSIRPSIGRILSSVGNQYATNPTSILAILSTRAATQSCPFSSTSERSMRRPRRDNNRLRGLSVIYRSGPRYRTNIDKDDLPKPSDYVPEVEVDPNHGLWQFFYAKDKLLLTPEEESQHGRGWSVEELRHKRWKDLHRLWWACIKEQNRISTARREKQRLKFGDGEEELVARLEEVRKTMKAIKHTLTERFYLWEDARKLAEADPEIDLSTTKNPYAPSSYIEDVDPEPPKEEPPKEEETKQIEGQQEEGTEKSAADQVDPSTLPPSPGGETQQPSAKV